MKKEAILLLIVLFLATATYAACDISATIDEGVSKSYTAKGNDYTIKFSSLKNESGDISVKFKINDISTPYLEETQRHSFDDLSEITITRITIGSGSINTSARICFNAGLSCTNCGTCSSSLECDDNNPCTIDECDGDPLRCKHKLILWCRDNDGCCPEGRCTIEQDSDCQFQPSGRCNNNSDCNDNNQSTKDICEKTTKRCTNIEITECISEDNFCPENCNSESDTDCDECSTDSDCNDDYACTTDTCSGTPKKCSNDAMSGCDFNETCIPIGTRTNSQFCHKENTMKPLRSKKEYCDNDYECLTNLCIKNKCKDISFIKKIINWFKELFGK